METDFWQFHPIQDAIATHLHPIDLWNCIRVSKTIHNAFIPFLWRNIHLTPINSPLLLASSALPFYRIHIQSISLPTAIVQDLKHYTDTHGAFPNLTLIEVDSDCSFWSYQKQEQESIHLAISHPKLHTFGMKNYEMSPQSLNPLLRLLKESKVLRCLELVLANTVLERSGLEDLWKASISLEKLSLSTDNMISYLLYGIQDDVLFHGVESGPAFKTRMTDLKIVQARDGMTVKFLKCCPELRRLTMSTDFQEPGMGQQLAWVLESTCLQLEELTLLGGNLDVLSMAKILEKCPRLKSLEVTLPRQFDISVLRTITGRHGPSLESLSFTGNHVLSMQEFLILPRSCPNLGYLQALIRWDRPPSYEEATLDATIPSAVKESQSWVCTGLHTLDLTFRDHALASENEDQMHSLFREINRLTGLKRLSLFPGVLPKDFTGTMVESLTYLSGLVNLREFRFQEDRIQRLTVDQLDVLLDTWPSLMSLIGLQGFWRGVSGEEVVQRLKVARDEKDGGKMLYC